MQNEIKTDILSLSYDELESFVINELGEAKYRAGQIFENIHRGTPPSDITSLSKALRQKLCERCEYKMPHIERKLVSAIDGTVKYLFRLTDGNCIESVVMRYNHGNTICISSQVGCRMGCRFCASTIGGRVRNLEPSELLSQVIAAQKDMGERISNIVMMGIGEPLDNFDNVVKFLLLVGEERGLNIGYRHISLSSCGIVDKIYRLAELRLPITLSISLHAPDDETRSAIMPINNKWGVDALLRACADYYKSTRRRISFEYTLIAGKNDSKERAEKLASVLNGALRSKSDTMPIHVNLIPVNEVEETGFKRSGDREIKEFAAVLEKRGIRATVRRKLGSDINASCGQLRREEMKDKEENN
ncbi:MAG: 23S rRNA (adenine(2503)-C(2))-methyltransferase RlmN [Clostridia bacterium]|nr:23S rRNA (adenine(2503)-C(2))-methyltransferase RlmN [Clostridia bacterium]